jgi:hypothetical protein
MSHPDDFCAPQPSRTIMGHPPTINPCHTTGRESIGVPFGMVDETIFVFHMSHPDEFLRAATIAHHHGPSADNQPMSHTRWRESIGVSTLAWLNETIVVFHMTPSR